MMDTLSPTFNPLRIATGYCSYNLFNLILNKNFMQSLFKFAFDKIRIDLKQILILTNML
jgi:hypothetical protein